MNDDGYAVEHLVVVTYDQPDDRVRRYRAACSCGWNAEHWRRDDTLAEADGDDHREVVLGPADAVDRVMGVLLDLQDDLARTTIWMAENWTAALPAPRAYACGSDTPGVVLSIDCLRPDDLADAARLLGVEAVDDAAPDPRGNRYRRAVRRFGRVRIEAFRRIDPACGGCGAETTEPVCPRCGEHVDARPVTLEVA